MDVEIRLSTPERGINAAAYDELAEELRALGLDTRISDDSEERAIDLSDSEVAHVAIFLGTYLATKVLDQVAAATRRALRNRRHQKLTDEATIYGPRGEILATVRVDADE